MLRITHPPAGAVPLATPLQSATLLNTILVSCVSLMALTLVHHRPPSPGAIPEAAAAKLTQDRTEPGSAQRLAIGTKSRTAGPV